MLNTLSIFEDRKEEVSFYFSIVEKIDINPLDKSIVKENSKLVKIMKSNIILMLYNLVEACTVSGILEIYENLKSENCSYNSVICEIQKLWTKYQVKQIYGPTTEKSTYENRIGEIINSILESHPVVLTKSSLDISGDLDARKIKKLCDSHRIRYQLPVKGESLQMIKRERNNLAHGDVSFSDCAKDISISQLRDIIEEVFSFMDSILEGMKVYYDNKGFKSRT